LIIGQKKNTTLTMKSFITKKLLLTWSKRNGGIVHNQTVVLSIYICAERQFCAFNSTSLTLPKRYRQSIDESVNSKPGAGTNNARTN
jgi:hypothetical protein